MLWYLFFATEIVEDIHPQFDFFIFWDMKDYSASSLKNRFELIIFNNI